MFVGQKIIVKDSIWTEANNKTGKIKSIIEKDYVLIDFDDREVNKLSRDVGGFTFKESNLKLI